MRSDGDLRSLLQTLGSAALGLGLGLGVLVAGFFISRATLDESSTAATTTSAPAPSRTATPIARASTPTPTTTVAPSPTRSPAPTANPLVVTPYLNAGRRYAALSAPVGYMLTSPISGNVSIATYQLIDGEVRVGSSFPDQPFYPYVTITSSDRRVILRPGARDKDIQLVATDGQAIAAGSPVFRIIGTGASSWRVFYDPAVIAQVIASVAAVPSGNELDPVPVFK